MIKVEKERVLEILELNPSFLIGKEIMMKGWGEGAKIIDVNLKCTQLRIAFLDESIKWINVDELENFVIFDEFSISYNNMITIKTLNDILEREKL